MRCVPDRSRHRGLDQRARGVLFTSGHATTSRGFIEQSFSEKRRDKPLKLNVFTGVFGAKVLFEECRRRYTRARPHSSLGERPPLICELLPG